METRPPVDAINTRLVLRAYAAIVVILGLRLLGPLPIAGDGTMLGMPYGLFSVARIAGMVMVWAGLTAIGLASIDDLISRRRALGWFVAGHFVVLFMMVLQRIAIWPPGLADWIVGGWALTSFALFYAWSTAFGDPPWWRPRATTVFGGDAPSGADQLRSHYEQQIRLAAAQEERHRLARDLHDSIKQQIFAIQMSAATAETRMNGDATGAQEAIDAVRSSAREAMAEMDAMTDQLRAAPLENAGLIAALKKQAEALGFRTGACVDVHIGTLPRNEWLPPGSQQAIFRVAQEALANIARHARATHVTLSLDAAGGALLLVIADDGVGCEKSGEHAGTGIGIGNMQARASEFRGRFAIGPGTEGGTVVRLSLPYVEVSSRDYLKKAAQAAAGIAILGMMLFLFRERSGWNTWPLLVIPTFELCRYLNAWMRARRPSPVSA